MAVPTLITDLSTTIASNSPSGSENVFPNLDDYLRAQSAFLASVRDNSGNGWVSPYLPLAGGTMTGTVSGLQINSLNGGAISLRNKIINGSFGIWQRGTSFPAAASIVYTADRWAFYRSALATGATAAQTTPTNIVGSSSYGIRVQRNSGNTSVDPLILAQCIETANVRSLQGKTVTVSFKQRTSASITAATILVTLTYGTGTDQGVNAARAGSWTSQGTLSGSFNTGSTTFTETSIQYAIPSTATELQLNFAYTPTGTAGANDFFDIADVQLEVGPVATPFEQRPYGMELALCLRYYQGYTGQVTQNRVVSTYSRHLYFLPVSMRSLPTVNYKDGAGNVSRYTGLNAADVMTNNLAPIACAAQNGQTVTLTINNTDTTSVNVSVSFEAVSEL